MATKNLAEFESWYDPQFKDGVHTETVIHLSWRDRFKVLIGKPIYLSCDTLTENVVGKTKTKSNAWVPPIFARHHIGYEEGVKDGD